MIPEIAQRLRARVAGAGEYRVIMVTLLAVRLSTAHASESAPESAAEPGSLWINPGFYAYHFQRDKGFRDNNYGLGAQYMLSPSSSVTAGLYRNSDNYESHYLGWIWQPLPLGRARLGMVAAAVDGYPKADNGRWFLSALPILSLDYRRFGVNFLVVPTYQNKVYGSFVTQLKLRVW